MILKADQQAIEQAAKLLRSGEVVAFPTETVYGLGANALNPTAVQKIFKLKGRPTNNPLIVHLASWEQIHTVANVPPGSILDQRLQSLQTFWPGPLSIVLPKKPCLPKIVTAGFDTVAVRIPAHPIALKLLEITSMPIAAPSANPSNYVSATNAKHVEDNFGSKLELILDGGNCDIGIESTVVSIAGEFPIVLRPGAVTIEQLTKILGKIELLNENTNTPAASPGLLSKHYSPRTPLRLRSEIDPSRVPAHTGLISFAKYNDEMTQAYERVLHLSSDGNLTEVSTRLFGAIRLFDQAGLELIIVDTCIEEGLGRAIMDRLKRASSHQ